MSLSATLLYRFSADIIVHLNSTVNSWRSKKRRYHLFSYIHNNFTITCTIFGGFVCYRFFTYKSQPPVRLTLYHSICLMYLSWELLWFTHSIPVQTVRDLWLIKRHWRWFSPWLQVPYVSFIRPKLNVY